jgi:hypothetical protein
MTVGEWLGASRAAHANYQFALRDGRIGAMRDALAAAQVARLEAHTLDPLHQDDAWQVERVAHQGLDLREDLLAFYASELAK